MSNPIDVIRLSLRTADYLRHSAEPFAGLIHNFSRPLRERFEARRYTSAYIWSPAKPGGGRGFYMGKGLRPDRNGAIFDLRLQEANEFLPSYHRRPSGYYCDNNQDGTLTPIIARLPKSRGFLAGWTMGTGMLSALCLDIHDSEEDAANAAHSMAEADAERMREDEERQNAENEEPEFV